MQRDDFIYIYLREMTTVKLIIITSHSYIFCVMRHLKSIVLTHFQYSVQYFYYFVEI